VYGITPALAADPSRFSGVARTLFASASDRAMALAIVGWCRVAMGVVVVLMHTKKISHVEKIWSTPQDAFVAGLLPVARNEWPTIAACLQSLRAASKASFE